MRWDDAILRAIDELGRQNPELNRAFLLLLLRAGQLTTDTSKCEKCGSGG